MPGQRVAGRALKLRHYGSVDIFLEAMQSAEAGDVLVIDNAGRLDEGCIGDLTALEAQRTSSSEIKRDQDPTYTFRKHLRDIGGAIEE